MIVHSFVPFPAEFVALANGMVYGPLWGTVITWVGAMLGASIAFWLARRLGRPFVERMVKTTERKTRRDWASFFGRDRRSIQRSGENNAGNGQSEHTYPRIVL